MSCFPFRLFIVPLWFALSAFSLGAKSISPLQLGLKEARTGLERYEILKRTHELAAKINCSVSYKGIRRIEIEIPSKSKPIPLSAHTDFAGVEIVVRNTVKNVYLFEMSQEAYEIKIDKIQLASGNFRSVGNLRRGTRLLIIEDKTPWVDVRTGHDYGAQRKDIVVTKRGRGLNSVVQTYSDQLSNPVFHFCSISPQKKSIENLVLSRTPDSTFKTFAITISNQYNVTLKNITINTPDSDMIGDRAIKIDDCAVIRFEDVTINGTYSSEDAYGYGISMNNVWNSFFNRLKVKGTGNWGVFGNNNISYCRIENSDINRFDIHCYGRDVYFKNTVFRDWYNQISSFYGKMEFVNCQFIDFIPVLSEASYSAYTPFDVEIRNCSWTIVRDNKAYLVRMGNSCARDDARPELNTVYWPNVKIEDLSISIECKLKDLVLFYVSGDKQSPIHGAEIITMDNVTIRKNVDKQLAPSVRFSNIDVQASKNRQIKITNSTVNRILQ